VNLLSFSTFFQSEFPLAPNVFWMLARWADLAVDFYAGVEFFGEAFQVAEPYVFAGKLA